jgi:hypothetical protein
MGKGEKDDNIFLIRLKSKENIVTRGFHIVKIPLPSGAFCHIHAETCIFAGAMLRTNPPLLQVFGLVREAA